MSSPALPFSKRFDTPHVESFDYLTFAQKGLK
jgi:hypothetical protein